MGPFPALAVSKASALLNAPTDDPADPRALARACRDRSVQLEHVLEKRALTSSRS